MVLSPLSSPKRTIRLTTAQAATAAWPRGDGWSDSVLASLRGLRRLELGRIELLLLLNLLLQAGDGLATWSGMQRGIGEGNPLIAGLMEAIGVAPALLFAKLGAICGLALLYRCRRHPLVEPGLVLLAAVYTVLSIVPWTLLLLAR